MVATAVASLAVALSACAPLGQQADPGDQAGDGKGYIAGDGTITEIPPGERGDPVTVTGPATRGPDIDTSAMRGDVVVLNLWYAACAPCRAEAGDLAAAARAGADRGVRFVGVNVKDSAANAQGFERTYDVPYPSVLDAGTQDAVLALRGVTSPQAVPTTLVLDREGRVAARVLGRADPAVLDDLVDGVVAEVDA